MQSAAKNLREIVNAQGNIYAVTLSDKYYFDELKEYTGNSSHIYSDERINQFIQVIFKIYLKYLLISIAKKLKKRLKNLC